MARSIAWPAAVLGTSVACAAAAGAVAGSAEQTPAAAQLLDPAYVARQACGPVKRKSEFFNPGFQIAAAQAATQENGQAAAPKLYDDLGTLTDPVTTRAPDAQRYFDQGLRLAYAFNHGEAVRAFRAAQAIDPTCAMCYGGEAYALGPNNNFPMQPEAGAPAFAAVAQATALKVGASSREQALIEALSARYSADPGADRKALDAAYAEAMAGVAARFPDDDQAQVLFADALMNLQPWDYWSPDKATPKGRTAEQVAALERVLARTPDHPGAIHLYIHTVEASTTPERAEPFADRLNGQMPGAGHLVHMPAHIYYRVGRYLDSLKVNVAAAAADEAMMSIAGKIVDGQLAHARGDYASAETALREAAAMQDALPYMEPPYWYYPARQTLGAVLLEAGKPAEAVQAFQASLIEAPNNAYALYGLIQAQEAAGDAAGAKVTRSLFDRAWAGGAELPQLAQL